MKMHILIQILVINIFLSCCNSQEAGTSMKSNQDNTTPDHKPIRFLALGDSYTIGESVEEDQRWPTQLADSLANTGFNLAESKIIAQTGWTTEELKEGIQSVNPQGSWQLVSLLIGVNNQYRKLDTAAYHSEFRELVQMAITFADNDPSRVIVVSIPDYGVTPFAQNMDPEKIAEEIDAFNAINFQVTKQSDAKYINVTTISRQAATDPSLIAEDGLHPSGKMYKAWVDVIYPLAYEIVLTDNKTDQ
jgi:lysophospholipase L1-like esterase